MSDDLLGLFHGPTQDWHGGVVLSVHHVPTLCIAYSVPLQEKKKAAETKEEVLAAFDAELVGDDPVRQRLLGEMKGGNGSIEGGAFGNSDASTDLSKIDLTRGNTRAVYPPSDLDSQSLVTSRKASVPKKKRSRRSSAEVAEWRSEREARRAKEEALGTPTWMIDEVDPEFEAFMVDRGETT